jgi:hypothetical protein
MAELLCEICTLFSDEVKEFVDDRMCRWALSTMQFHPYSNILHNALVIVIETYIKNNPL